MRSSLLCVLLLTGCITPLTSVVVVRHAEKEEDGTDDPGLTDVGQARAERLAVILERIRPDVIFATQYRRTQETVRPLAGLRSTPLVEVDAGSTAELARRILSEHRGQTVVVAGHSNTVNRLIAALGGPSFPDLGDADYDSLFVLTVGKSEAKLLPLRFGLP